MNKEKGRRLREKIKKLEKEIKEIEEEILIIQKQIPNLCHPDAPVGKRIGNTLFVEPNESGI